MTDLDTIRERLRIHQMKEWRGLYYGLRMLVAGEHDRKMATTSRYANMTDHPDIIKRQWDEGVANPAGNNTHIQSKALTIVEPRIRWEKCQGDRPEITAEVRKEFYLYNWRKSGWDETYRLLFLDLLTLGECNELNWIRDGATVKEYVDSLRVTWDPGYKEQGRRRWVIYDKDMPTSEAAKLFPNALSFTAGRDGEKTVTISCYWDKETRAFFKGNELLGELKPNPAQKIPVKRTIFFQEASVAHPTGTVERQIGSHSLLVRLYRSFRSMALRMAPVGTASGSFEEKDLRRIEDGEEGVILRSDSPQAKFLWTSGGELTPAAKEAWEIARQNNSEESGVNDFQKSRTDTSVDFASQLAFLAQQSGVQGTFADDRSQSALRDGAREFMWAAGMFERNPVSLPIGGMTVEFDGLMPIYPLLGEDGEITFAPGGLQYKAPMQRLQEIAILGQVLQTAGALHPSLQAMFIRGALDSYEYENVDEVMASFEQIRAEEALMAQQQNALAMAQSDPSQNPPQGPTGAPGSPAPSRAPVAAGG